MSSSPVKQCYSVTLTCVDTYQMVVEADDEELAMDEASEELKHSTKDAVLKSRKIVEIIVVEIKE